MIRLKRAVEIAKENGKLKKRSELAGVLWQKSSPKSAYMNLKNLIDGKSKKIDIESVPVICDICGVSADFLFGLSESPNNEDAKRELLALAKEVAAKSGELVDTINNI